MLLLLLLGFTYQVTPPTKTTYSLPLSHHVAFLPFNLAGIWIMSLSVWWGWFFGLQTHTAAHHTSQSQGPALLFGEWEIYQSLPFPLQGLSQIGLMSERTGGTWSVWREHLLPPQRVHKRLLEMNRRRATTWHILRSLRYRSTWNAVVAVSIGRSTSSPQIMPIFFKAVMD